MLVSKCRLKFNPLGQQRYLDRCLCKHLHWLPNIQSKQSWQQPQTQIVKLTFTIRKHLEHCFGIGLMRLHYHPICALAKVHLPQTCRVIQFCVLDQIGVKCFLHLAFFHTHSNDRFIIQLFHGIGRGISSSSSSHDNHQNSTAMLPTWQKLHMLGIIIAAMTWLCFVSTCLFQCVSPTQTTNLTWICATRLLVG